MKNSFIYRQYRGNWEYHLDRYQATIQNRLIQLFPKVEEEIGVTFTASCEEEMWDKICTKINELENIKYDEQD